MQKSCYAVYTKPNCEKKVATILSKKKIECFLPLNSIKIQLQKRNRIIQEPLFSSNVFVHLPDGDISLLKHVDGIINLLYWMGAPAIINDNEIEAIKQFTNNFFDIKLEPAQVSVNELQSTVEGPSFSIDGKFFALKNKIIRVGLPSLGYNMIAKREEESIFGRETNILQNNSFVHS
jgi:transcription antitermination factor NusG